MVLGGTDDKLLINGEGPMDWSLDHSSRADMREGKWRKKLLREETY